MSSTLSWPLRVRVTSSSSDARACDAAVSSTAPGRAGRRPSMASTRYSTAVTDSWSAGARSTSRDRAGDIDAFGQRGGERARQGVGVDGLGELDVEVLGVALVTDRERQPEADLRPGREPSVNASGSCSMRKPARRRGRRRGARRTAPCPAWRSAAAPGTRCRPSSGTLDGDAQLDVDGAAPDRPKARPWPVPWLPPAGGTAEATTCSRA